MKTYLIAIDSPMQETIIANRIKTFSRWARPMSNVWLIQTPNSRVSVYNFLLNGVYFSGKILIIHVDDDWVSRNLDPAVVKWMQGGL